MKCNFYKYHGAGNDFILIDNRNKNFPAGRGVVANLCTRRTGIGADGLILLESSGNADFSMRYFNADGGESTLCGNGGRCITAFAARLGMIENKTVFSAIDGLHEAEILHYHNTESLVKLKMNHISEVTEMEEGIFLNTGSPHLIIFTEDTESIDVVHQGRKLRNLEKFAPDGVNVNFVQSMPGGIRVRTYERGVEDETLSCGTGVVASSVALSIANGSISGPVSVETRGGNLQVNFKRSGSGFGDIWLEGPAAFVYSGIIHF